MLLLLLKSKLLSLLETRKQHAKEERLAMIELVQIKILIESRAFTLSVDTFVWI